MTQPSPTPDDVRRLFDERGWLIEESFGGMVHWLALVDGHWPRTTVRHTGRNRDYELEQFVSPVRRVNDANEALRFARKEDADAFIALFCRFISIGEVTATEHEWPAARAGWPADRERAEIAEAEAEKLDNALARQTVELQAMDERADRAEARVLVDRDEARLALFKAIEAITYGNKTDDKLILNELKAGGYWLVRACSQCGGAPIRDVLDGEALCQPCCEKWAQGEGEAARTALEQRP